MNENDSKELIEYLDGKFEKIGMTLENKADKADVNNLTNAVDAYIKKADTYFQEMAAMKNRMDRHDRWFQEIAQKIGIKLEH
ncbi:MAG: hypothetical protein RIG61_00960 [Deltaproteobacteria bacterium]